METIVKKVLSCLIIIAILMSAVPFAVVAQDASNDIAESKRIQEQAAAEEFKSQAYTVAEDKIQSLSSQTDIFVGQGFDKCEIPTLSQMQNWITNSPYRAVNLYIGGSCRSCPNSALTASYVSQLSQQGWKFIPTWVGPQSACWGGSCGSRISNDPATAYNQGISEANAAIAVAIDLRLALADGSGTIIYYDLEGYDTTNTACRNAAKSFISGWTAQLHARGSEAGVYGSAGGSAISDFASISNVPDAIWPAHWIYSSYNSGATVWDVAYLSNDLWANHQRIRQYAGGHDETWGGVTLNIDCNVIDGIVASPYGLNTIAAVSTYNTILDDLDELVSNGKIPGYNLYTDSNIDDLWTNLDQYKILLIDEDCIFEWTNPCNPDCNKPIPTTTVGVSFYNHKTELKDWVYNGGGLFCTDQNDVSVGYTDAESMWWTWLPDELQVESNEFPSDYPVIGYGHYPENLEIITDPWIFSTPNEIDITKVAKGECHGRFTYYPGYTALVRDKSDGDILEVYREYGSGVVVLSHVEYETADPWDVDYIENEMNFVKPDRKDINLKLYIEDAIAGRREGSPPVVNKAQGDMIDIVAVVVNKEETSQTVDVELSVPPEFGNPEKVIVREDFSPQSKIEEIEPGVLSVELTNLESGKKIQVVWRFKILDSASPQSTIVEAEAKVGNVLCAADTGGLHIVDNVDAIIVTNRYLLYDKYDDDVDDVDDDVDSLLTYLYQISAWGNTISKKNCIVYYVDYYDEDLEGWDQEVDYSSEDKANVAANKIDNLIEKWEKKTKPRYLMIVGGDEIIPYYRIKDPVKDEEGWDFADKQSSNPTFKTYGNGYFFTDNTYATSGNNWDHGELDISLGRIIGYDALDIEKLIENGCTKKSPAGRAVVASICNWDMGTKGKPYSNIPEDLRNRGFDVKNDGIPASETPSTVDNDEWSENDLQNAVALGADIIIMGAHAEHTTSIICNENWWFRGTEMNTKWDNNGQISNYHPLIYVGGCHGGCPVPAPEGLTQGNLVYGLIQHNALAYIGATGFSYSPGSYDDYDGGGNAELFMQYFINKALKNTGESHKIGLALRAAKVFYNDYVPGGNDWDAEDRKTVTEYILYGVPWSRISYPQGDSTSSSYASRFATAASEDNLTISISEPIGMGNNTFKRIIDVNVSGYQVHKEDDYDIFTIHETSLSSNTMKPVLPVAKIRFSLPKEALIQDLSIIDNVSSIIGVYNVPSIEPGSWSDPGGYTNQSDVIGWYPVPPYSMDYSNYESSTFITIETAPIQYNTTSKEVRLYNYTKLELTYQTPITAAITDFAPDKTEYTSGEMINASLTMENVGSDALTGLQANLQLKDPYGQVKALGLSSTFDVASGESKTVYATLNQNLPHGSYLAEMILINSTGDAFGSSSEYIYIKSGGIVDFFLPAEVESGDDITATITFKNDNTTSVTATGVVYIYDPHDIEIAELYSAPTDIAANSTGTMNIIWSMVGREIGNYTASAVVFIGEEAFGPEYRTFEIKQKPILHTDLPNVELVSADSTVTRINVTGLNLSEINETYKPEECITPQSAYMINSTGAGNFTLKFTDISDANTIIAYKIKATNYWIPLDTTTTANTVTFTMSVGDPPVVFGFFTPIGGFSAAILPKINSATAAESCDFTVRIRNTQNFDEDVVLDLTLTGIPAEYAADLAWFNWTTSALSIPAGEYRDIGLRVDIPEGISGYRSFGIVAQGTFGDSKDYGVANVTLAP